MIRMDGARLGCEVDVAARAGMREGEEGKVDDVGLRNRTGGVFKEVVVMVIALCMV